MPNKYMILIQEYAYKGIGLEDTDIQIKEWIDNYAQPHNICSMCPTSHNNAFFSHWDKVKLK